MVKEDVLEHAIGNESTKIRAKGVREGNSSNVGIGLKNINEIDIYIDGAGDIEVESDLFLVGRGGCDRGSGGLQRYRYERASLTE
jgi:hypothetical protein